MLQSVAEKDTEALLLREVLLNCILTIGTLGHDVDLCPEACIEENVLLTMGEQKVAEEKYEVERNDKVQEDIFVTTPTELAPAVQPAKLHSSLMKEESFMCFIEEEIRMREAEESITNIQEQPLLMVEKVEKIRTTLADLFAAEVFSASYPVENTCHNVTTVPGASTSKPMLCMEEMHQKKPTKATPKSLKATRKLSRRAHFSREAKIGAAGLNLLAELAMEEKVTQTTGGAGAWQRVQGEARCVNDPPHHCCCDNGSMRHFDAPLRPAQDLIRLLREHVREMHELDWNPSTMMPSSPPSREGE